MGNGISLPRHILIVGKDCLNKIGSFLTNSEKITVRLATWEDFSSVWRWENNDLVDRTFLEAALEGNVQALKWMQAKGLDAYFSSRGICEVVRVGQLESLKWIVSTRRVVWKNIPRACPSAAEGGHLDVLTWLKRDQKCPWDECTWYSAESAGHIHILEFLRQNNMATNPRKRIDLGTSAIEKDHVFVVVWIGETFPVIPLVVLNKWMRTARHHNAQNVIEYMEKRYGHILDRE